MMVNLHNTNSDSFLLPLQCIKSNIKRNLSRANRILTKSHKVKSQDKSLADIFKSTNYPKKTHFETVGRNNMGRKLFSSATMKVMPTITKSNFYKTYKFTPTTTALNKSFSNKKLIINKNLTTKKFLNNSLSFIKKKDNYNKQKQTFALKYASKHTYKTLSEIIRKKDIVDLKKIEDDYVQFNIYNNSINNQNKSKSSFKIPFMKNNEKRSKFISATNFPLSVLRTDYKNNEIERRKNFRITNLKNIYHAILSNLEPTYFKFVQENYFNDKKNLTNIMKAKLQGKIPSKDIN